MSCLVSEIWCIFTDFRMKISKISLVFSPGPLDFSRAFGARSAKLPPPPKKKNCPATALFKQGCGLYNGYLFAVAVETTSELKISPRLQLKMNQ